MDDWEALVKCYKEDNNPKTLQNILNQVQELVSDDLAPFEVEYILSTLFGKPINLLHTVRDKRTKEEWDDCVSDTLKLLTKLVSEYSNIDIYYKDIVSICLLPYTARIRQLALTCVTKIVPKWALPATYIPRHLNALEETNTCVAPLVMLIGAICEHHPEQITENFNRIWRIFLNLLDDNKNTLAIKKAVLQGILSLFKHYGVELSTLELDQFYGKLVMYTKTLKFQGVCLSILEDHSGLFRERLSNDVSFRNYLWNLENSRSAILSVYKRVADTVREAKLVEIIGELEKNINSPQYYKKFTALYALLYINTKCTANNTTNLNDYIDIQTVDFEIRNGNINYEICDAIFWCIKSNVLYSDKLLQTALLFYENFTQNKRKELLQCFIEADVAIRKPASIFLTNYPQSLVWRDLLKMIDENEQNVDSVIKYVQSYIIHILEREEDNLSNREVLPNNIKSLATILAFLPSLSSFRVLSRYAKMYKEFVPSAILYGNDIRGENISIEHCLTDDDKLRCSVSYVDRDDYVVSEMIIAFETILSSTDISALNIKKTINKLEKIIQRKQLNEEEISKILYKVHIVFQRIDKTKKEHKILERNIILFMAQYGRCIQKTEMCSTFIKELESILVLDVDSGLKLKLGSLIVHALEYDNIDALNILYKLICSKLALRKDVTLRKAFLLVVTKLSRYDVDQNVTNDVKRDLTGDVTCDVMSDLWKDVDGVMELFQFIMGVKSMKSRKTSCNILKEVLKSDDNDLLENFLENLLIVEPNDSNNQSILELLEICITMLEANNYLSKNFLPNIILRVLNVKKYNNYIFNTTGNLFTDKIQLFDTKTIDYTIDNVLKIINKMGSDDRFNITMALNLIKKIFDLEKNSKSITEYYFDGNKKINLYILIDIKIIFQLDDSKCKEMIERDDVLLLFEEFDECFCKDAIFDFVKTFGNHLLNHNQWIFFSVITKCLEGLSPRQMSFDNIQFCLSLIESHDETYYNRIQESVKKIIEQYPIKEITEGIEKYSFDSHHEIYVLALKKILECYAEPILIEFSEVLSKRWFERIAGLHELGVIERNWGSKMEYLTDLVDVSLRFVSREQFQRFLLNGEGVKFCRTFIRATFNRLIEKPYITLSPGAESASVILVDILQYAAVNDKNTQAVEMAEALWPIFCNVSTHEEKIQALTYLTSLPPRMEQWVIDTVNDSHTKLERKIEFIIATADKITGLHSTLRAHLPSRVSELRGVTATCFRLYLDVLSRNNLEVLEQVAQMAANDDTKGWWDDAIQMCMSAAATAGGGAGVLSLVHSRCGIKLLVPLLRSSKISDVEVFFSTTSNDIISTLKKFPRATEHCLYEECVSEYVKALNISQIIFEKVPKENIDKNFVKTICKLCHTLRDKVDASSREFHCANYNCLVAAICLMDPGAAVYKMLFEPNVWMKLIDEKQIELPIREQWNQRITRHATCNSTPNVTLTMASARTQMFTRTLSEDPYMYDLTRDDDCDTVQFQEMIVKDNIINRHPCTASFKTLFNKRNGIEDELCRKSLEDTIKNNNIHINVRWLLAQAICNSKEELKAYASTLQPALLDLVVNTAQDNKLNDLHMDVLDTLILWHENIEYEGINKTIGLLINTAIHYVTRNSIYYSLMDRLVKLLNVWQNVVIPWSCFEKHLTDSLKPCIHILKNIVKCNKYIKELVPTLIHLIETKQTFIEVCEVFSVALQLENNREQWLTRFRSILQDLYRKDVMEYLKVLYYTQIGCPSVCDYNNCRKIKDVLQKIPAAREKLKCLRILDAYIRNVRNEPVTAILETVNIVDHLGSSEGLKLAKTSLTFLSVIERENLLTAILKENYKKELHQHVEEFLIEYLKLKLQSDYEPPAKRPARESKSLLLCYTDKCNTLTKLSNYGGNCIHGLTELLNDDLRIRFYECFYIMIIMSKSKSEMSFVRLLDLFMYRFKSESREEVSSFDVSRHHTREERIDMILKYCKKNPQVALSLTLQLLQVYPKSPEFDFMDDDIVDLLLVPTPWALEVVRAADIWRCKRLHNAISDLMQQTKDTDIEHFTKLLYEEYKLYNEGPEQFTLGLQLCYDENMPEVSTKFSIEDLVTSFGKLSNWSDLTLRQKKTVKDELPCLWTTTENLRKIIIEEQFQAPMWLNAMISIYKNDNSVDVPYDVYKSPRNYFDLSVVAEISTWNEIRNGLQTKEIVLSDIQPSDCLARWAARIMMRSVYLSSLSPLLGEEACALSRSHAAAWCARAGETAIHKQVLHCCKTTTDLYESEMLQWLYLKLDALRSIASEKNNIDGLQSALDIADTHAPLFLEMSSDENIIKMDLVTMQVRGDLKCLNKKHIDDILEKIENSKEIKKSANYKKHLESMCVQFMTFLDQRDFENDNYRCRYIFFANSIYLAMANVLSIYVQLNLGGRRRLLANVIINKVKAFGTVLPTETQYILDVLYLIINDLDDISIAQLVSSRDLFRGSHSLWAYLEENKVDRVKRHFALIGDPQYLLYSYCQRLLNTNNFESFDQIMNVLKKAIFENDLAQLCPDYQILNKFKGSLYSINFEDKEKTREVLSSTISQCEQSRAYVYLSQTCSVLAGASETEDTRDYTLDTLNTLLRLPRGVTVVSFDEKIQIMTNALHRPAILTCRLSNGRRLRCIIKRGARVREHCAAMALNHALGLRHSYRIEPLNDTCCVIEYLENYEPFRKMITDKNNIDIPDISNRTCDKELILDTTRSLEEFQRLCDKLPSCMLRNAIEESAITVEDFINKKKNFLESVSDMTLFSYIFELDDRHLENMMYSMEDGGACHVDCDAILQDGGDIPPARLTRNVLAVCNTQVLEARVQSKMSRVREEHRLISPSLSLALAYMGEQYAGKFNQIQNTIKGKELSFNCTIERLSVSKMPNKEKYIELLKEVFKDFEKKTEYSVEEQVSSLFRQSTDQRILSVTRSGWEPWI